jgi:cysteine desulfurase/selenocysteine lyase
MIDVREKFPILQEMINGRPLTYLDSAASSQLPQEVINAFAQHYSHDHSNIHRGIHTLAERSTQKYEDARAKVAGLIGASPEEVIFTSGTTAGINLLAQAIVPALNPGDEIVVTEMDHHSNFVMWQQLAAKHGIAFKIIPVTPDYLLDMEAARGIITQRTRIVAAPHISNVLGTINPIKELAAIAHQNGAIMVVDGAQAVAHIGVNVIALDADAYAFSGHKMYAPTGIGALYLRKDLAQRLPPFHYGGGMIEQVSANTTTFQDSPSKFEAGTPDIVGAVCLGAAVDFIRSIGMQRIIEHERELTSYALERIKSAGLAIIGPQSAQGRIGVISFIVDSIHAHDVAAALDQDGIAVRAGHHCAQPLAERYGIPATVRASFGVYSTKEDIDRLVDGVGRARRALEADHA